MSFAFLRAGLLGQRIRVRVRAARDDRGLPTRRLETCLCQAEQEVAMRLLRVPGNCLSNCSEDAESGIGHHHRIGGHLRELLAAQRRFRDRVLAVHRSDGGQERCAAGQFVSHDR